MRYSCRCRKCSKRKTLRKHPNEYKIRRHVKCICGGDLRIDVYRQSGKENTKTIVCRCDGWPFPHRETENCRRGWLPASQIRRFNAMYDSNESEYAQEHEASDDVPFNEDGNLNIDDGSCPF